jgi:hypothetical protein
MKDILRIYANMPAPKTTELFLFTVNEQIGEKAAKLIYDGLIV